MIRYIKRTLRDKELKRLDKYEIGTWVLAENPDLKEVDNLVDELNVDEGHVRDALDIFEVPRLEFENGIPYIFTRVPNNEAKSIFTTPLLIVIGGKYLLTVSEQNYQFLEKFLNKKTNFYTTQKIKFFIQIFKEVNKQYNQSITQISRSIYNTSSELDKVSNKQIQQLVFFEQKLNDYLNALIRNSTILNTLMGGRTLELYQDDKELIEDLVLESEQLVQLAKNSLSTVKNIRDAYSAILTNNLNRVIKLLTALTIILTIPTMIASFFGMNVELPINESEIGFWLITGSATLISIILFVIFYKNDWM